MSNDSVTSMVVKDVITWSIGDTPKHPSNYSKTMIQVIKMIMRRKDFLEIAEVEKVKSTEDLKAIANGIFCDNITWAKIIVFYAFMAHMARYKPLEAPKLVTFLQSYCEVHLNEWIFKHTWDEFDRRYCEIPWGCLLLQCLLVFVTIMFFIF